ncbi:hypothetical protein T492DRAFT_833917 [Pavlovales sp. CCMP2436]|nr:hypothetical protein T492DRAFT_833917 [Pavlovales sp. CCMP2436]
MDAGSGASEEGAPTDAMARVQIGDALSADATAAPVPIEATADGSAPPPSGTSALGTSAPGPLPVDWQPGTSRLAFGTDQGMFLEEALAQRAAEGVAPNPYRARPAAAAVPSPAPLAMMPVPKLVAAPAAPSPSFSATPPVLPETTTAAQGVGVHLALSEGDVRRLLLLLL